MDRTIIELGPAETAAKLIYVAISRVRTLEGLTFMDGCITHSKLARRSKAMELWKREDDRLQALFDAQRQPVPSASNPTPAKSQPLEMLHCVQMQGVKQQQSRFDYHSNGPAILRRGEAKNDGAGG